MTKGMAGRGGDSHKRLQSTKQRTVGRFSSAKTRSRKVRAVPPEDPDRMT